MALLPLSSLLHRRAVGRVKPRRDGAQAEACQRFAAGLRSVADLIAPGGVEVSRDHVRLDRQYVRALKVTGYPRTVSPGWLEPLLALGETLDVSLHLHPLPSGDVVRSLTGKLVQLQSSRLRDARGGRLADPEREVAYEDAERLRDSLQRGEQRIFSVGLYVLLRATSRAALDEASRRVEVALAGMLVESRVAVFEQDVGLRACLPQAQDGLLASRNLDTDSVVTTFPFSPALPSTDGGVLYGIATRDHAPIVLDPFDPAFENANHAVFARSGSGKSYFVKLLALRQLVYGTEFLVVDPEDEYRRLCVAVGGQRIRLAAGSEHQLNPFDLPAPAPTGEVLADVGSPASSDEADPLAEKVAALAGLCEVMLAEPGGRLGVRERALLDRALYETYATAGITRDPATHARPAPLMRDLLAALERTPGDLAADLGTRLARYVDGSARGLFAGPTNVALTRPFTVFDVHALGPELRPLAIHVIASFVWGQIHRSRRPRLLIVDEAWSLLQYPEGGAFLAGLARRARKYYLGLVTVTQDAGDFLSCEHGRTVLANAAVKLLLKQDGSTIDPVGAAFQLSPEERQLLLGAAKGEGLLFARGARVPLKVEASRKEHQLATTAPWEVAGATGSNSATSLTSAADPPGTTPPRGTTHHEA